MEEGMSRSWSQMVLFFILFRVTWAAFIPVRTPFNDEVYVTDQANQSLIDVTLTECSVECLFFTAIYDSNVDCRCFNYNSTSSNCSIFNYEPSAYALSLSDSTTAYQSTEWPLQGLWSTIGEDDCSFPFMNDGQVYGNCKHIFDTRHGSDVDSFACYQSNGQPAFCIPRNEFSEAAMSSLLYPFVIGADTSRSTSLPFVDCNNGASQDITGAYNFKFFGQTMPSLQISVNGIITFGYSNIIYTAYEFPSTRNGIAIFFTDVDFVCGLQRKTGDFSYQVTTDAAILKQVVSDLQTGFSFSNSFANLFQPKWLLVVTWNNVTFWPGSNPDKLATFQALLITDGKSSYVVFNYDELTWTTGSASGGIDGLDGIAATAGFDAGDGVRYYTLPGAMTSAILNLTQSSNCNYTGRWMFGVSGMSIVVPSSLPRVTYSSALENFQLIPANNCSFPFTYNGVLYNQCGYNIAGITDDVHRFACLQANRKWALCILPADYIAVYLPINMTIGSARVPVMSVFGWIIIHQKNSSSSFDWNLAWRSYKEGFGTVDSDSYWLGLERMRVLTTSGKYKLRVEVQQNGTGRWFSVEYRSFSVRDESTKYTLNVDGYTGDAGDGLRSTQTISNRGCQITMSAPNGMKFSTRDADNDLSSINCASQHKSGFWYNSCSTVQLTSAPQAWMEVCTVSFSRMMIKPL